MEHQTTPSFPDQSTNNQPVPPDPVPLESVPLESVPLESVPLESVPLESVPLESVPLESVPLESVPLESVPLESVPLESVPLESVPLESVPLESVPLESIPLRMHPRVFAALGKDLVTNDIVAVMELVKNSYDAFADNVWLTFGRDEQLGRFLEILDDGTGMTRDIIENVWCLVATPYRESYPTVTKEGRSRRVVGAKGLGRLAVARLGESLIVTTQALHSDCWEFAVDWSDIASKENLADTAVTCRKCSGPSLFETSGTRLRILELTAEWDDNQIDDLIDNLARLVSPFARQNEFNIFLSRFGGLHADHVRITSSEFLTHPKYSFEGSVDPLGNVSGSYRFNPFVRSDKDRRKQIDLSWYNIRESLPVSQRLRLPEDQAQCGPFSFEVRAWDIGPADTQEIADTFTIQRGLIRRSIAAHKGISLYRDGVLVLPKSDSARDWLGLDLRRVGRVGPRLSTSQVVGYVAITAENNPGVVDTSDRERLSSSPEVAQFEEILRAIIRRLEEQRNEDRTVPYREKPMADLFQQLAADQLVSNVTALAKDGAPAARTVSVVRDFAASLDQTRRSIEDRFVYYSRLATVGTIAEWLVHEIRNRTTSLGAFLRFVRERFGPFQEERTNSRVQRSEEAVDALEHLADTFAPLASRHFTRRQHRLIPEHRIRACLEMTEADIRTKGIECNVPNSQTAVIADPADLDMILMNLMINALYWLGEVEKGTRRLDFEVASTVVGNQPRVSISIHDTGPGIDDDDLERIFLPGVTRKPDGIGMGLTIASELVSLYAGEMKAQRQPTATGGASFTFDLPAA